MLPIGPFFVIVLLIATAVLIQEFMSYRHKRLWHHRASEGAERQEPRTVDPKARGD
jgi:hypothetical protein